MHCIQNMHFIPWVQGTIMHADAVGQGDTILRAHQVGQADLESWECSQPCAQSEHAYQSMHIMPCMQSKWGRLTWEAGKAIHATSPSSSEHAGAPSGGTKELHVDRDV